MNQTLAQFVKVLQEGHLAGFPFLLRFFGIGFELRGSVTH